MEVVEKYGGLTKLKEIMKKWPFEHYTIETEIDKESCDIEN